MLRIRLLVISVFFCLLFACAIARLVELQYHRSGELAAYRDNRLSHLEQKPPRRGRILDVDGKVLAEDQPTQDLWIVPARSERVNRRRQVIANLPPLTPEQLLAIAAAKGEEREFEYRVAVASLAEVNPMVTELAKRLNMEPAQVAEKVLSAVLQGRPSSNEDLIYAKPAIPDIDFALALEIRAARANPYGEEKWQACEIRTGGKRSYPAGRLLAHILGAVGKLSAEEYLELRGRWQGEEREPGQGKIVKQGKEFFSIQSEGDFWPSDEERILALREVKRSGKMVRTQGYLANEMVGRGGMEQYYNQVLRGRHKLQSLRLARDEKSGRRRFVPKGDVMAAENGLDLRLSLRMETQRQAAEILERHIKEIAQRPELRATDWTPSGVAIMMDPRNGRIHAMVSLPNYDPNTFNQDFTQLMEDPALPLVDRAVAGIYPPGSVVKPLVGLAAVSENAVMPGQRFFCDRVMMLAGARFTCLGRHGEQDLESALMHSCNTYFYHAGEALGGRRLYEWYQRFGLGHRTGIDIAGEAGGILPRNAFTRRGWATGNTYHMAIGQGIAVTPLQIAVMFAALANADSGVAKIVRPHLLIPPKELPSSLREEALAKEAMQLDLPIAEIMMDKDALALVRQGLWEVVQGKPESGEFGTGRFAAFPVPGGGFLMEIAGKTGTAEWSQVVNGTVRKQISHVWFAAYAPFDRPEVVVLVLLPEAGGGGGGTCAPIAKDLLRMWFNLPERLEHAVYEEDALG